MIINEDEYSHTVLFNPDGKNNGDDDLGEPVDEMVVETEAEPEEYELGAEEARKFRAVTARLNYLAVDRIDIQYAVKEAARRMSKPLSTDWKAVLKIGRYLAGKPRLIMTFPWQQSVSVVTTYTDSDWAGCPITSRSTSGGIISLGGHMIKSYARQQRVVALSSAEAELYAMVAASAETLAMIAYCRDLGFAVGGEVYADSAAALGISNRAGIGKVRHLRTQGMWIQEVRVGGRLAYKKVLGTKNPADVLTKHVPGELLERHLESIGAEARLGRAETAPELNSVESLVLRLPVDWEAPARSSAADGAITEPPDKPLSGPLTKTLTWAPQVQYRAIPATGRGRAVTRRSRELHRRVVPAADVAASRQTRGGAAGGSSCPGGAGATSWADLTEEQYGP